MTVTLKFAGPACPPSVNFEGSQGILRAIGPRTRLILTPVYKPYNTSFHKNESKFGGAVWVRGVVKVFGRGWLVKLHSSYFAYNKTI